MRCKFLCIHTYTHKYICMHVFWQATVENIWESLLFFEWGLLGWRVEGGHWGMLCDCCWAAASHIGSWLQMGVVFAMLMAHPCQHAAGPLVLFLVWQQFFDDVAKVKSAPHCPYPLQFTSLCCQQSTGNWSWWNFWVVFYVDISNFYWFNYLLSCVVCLTEIKVVQLLMQLQPHIWTKYVSIYLCRVSAAHIAHWHSLNVVVYVCDAFRKHLGYAISVYAQTKISFKWLECGSSTLKSE